MMKALLRVRFRALTAMFIQRGRQKKKQSMGTTILFAFLYLYLGAVVCGMSGLTFYALAKPYHMLELDWLYFAMAGLSGLGIAVIGSVFTTQNQLYDAKDNPLLLSMPIPPTRILLSRMLPLLALNLLFASIVMVPAIVVYAVWIDFQVLFLLLQILSIPAIAILAQTIGCLLGWLLHLFMSRVNKSIASVVFMLVFLVAYFVIYYNANDILNTLIMNTDVLADTLSAWVWPIYAMGKGCTGSLWQTMAFTAICAAAFALVYWALSATFLKTATMSFSGRKARKLRLAGAKESSPMKAIIGKELGKFVSTPVYLTNAGVGILLTAALPVAGIFFRDKVMQFITLLMLPSDMTALLVCAVLSFLVSTLFISTPTVSLEGKNLWILKSMPVSPKQILNAKLGMHILLTVPVTALAGLVLGITYECGILGTVFCAVLPALLALLNGVLGMVSGLKWARFDYVNEAYPCKQSVSVAVSMFGMMGLPLALGLLYGFVLYDRLTPLVFLASSGLLLAAMCFGFYMLMTRWGTKQWNRF